MSQTLLADPVATIRLTENEIRFYHEEGYLYLPGLLSVQAVEAIKSDILEVMAASGRSYEDLCASKGASGKLLQSNQYLAQSALDEFINSSNLRSIASQLMKGESSLYMPFTAVKSGGGGGTFHFHQDNQYTRFDGPGINLWTAFSPMSPENGCLNVVPRSHLHGTEDEIQSPDGDGHRTVSVDPTQFLPIRMNPGDCIAFTRLTLHGSGPNNTNEPRVAYANQFYRNDVNAVWDGREPCLLKENPRWDTAPVSELTKPDGAGRDGH